MSPTSSSSSPFLAKSSAFSLLHPPPFPFSPSSSTKTSDGRRPRQGRGPARRRARAPRLPRSRGSCGSARGRQEGGEEGEEAGEEGNGALTAASASRPLLSLLLLGRRRRRLLRRAPGSAPALLPRRGLAAGRRAPPGSAPWTCEARSPSTRPPSPRRALSSTPARWEPRPRPGPTPLTWMSSASRPSATQTKARSTRGRSTAAARPSLAAPAVGPAARRLLRLDGPDGSLDPGLARQGEAGGRGEGAGLAGDGQVSRVGPGAPFTREVRMFSFRPPHLRVNRSEAERSGASEEGGPPPL